MEVPLPYNIFSESEQAEFEISSLCVNLLRIRLSEVAHFTTAIVMKSQTPNQVCKSI